MYCRLYDLPAGKTQKRAVAGSESAKLHDPFFQYFSQETKFRQLRRALQMWRPADQCTGMAGPGLGPVYFNIQSP